MHRAMFASNSPVDKLRVDYRTLWQGFAALSSSFSEDERAALFRNNARRYYGIPSAPQAQQKWTWHEQH